MVFLLTIISLLAIFQQAFAFPSIASSLHAHNHAHVKTKRVNGILPGFNAEAQRIDVSGDHAFLPPGHGDLRGPCPGLNALANHNYLPRNGVATIPEFIAATTKVFGMGLDLATFLSNYGAIIDGDLMSFSVGGPPASKGLVSSTGLLSQPQGLSGGHNKHETDGSPTRGDLYQFGNDYLMQMKQFKALYDKQSHVSNADANYDLDILNAFRAERLAECRSSNPYFFSAPFPGLGIQPATYTFIYRFMANKSAEHPEGILNKEVLKSFFAVTGSDDDLKYTPGFERIPENWYKRAIGDEYTIPFYFMDAGQAALKYPQFLEVGGNTGTVDSFVGLDPSDLTGGVYNSESLAEGNNAGCFAFQAAAQAKPDVFKGLEDDAVEALEKLISSLDESLAALGCPQLKKIDEEQFKRFPGYSKLKRDGSY